MAETLLKQPFEVPVSRTARVTVSIPDRPLLMLRIGERLSAGTGFALATLNLDHVVKLQAPGSFRRAYGAQDFVVADGNPIAWLSRLARRPVDVIPGSELIDPLCELAATKGVPVAFLGSTQETLDHAATVLKTRYPGLRIVARIAPPHGLDPEGAAAEAALAEVGTAGARLCFLALGAPKQEILAVLGREIVPGCGFISIGAGLDFIAGSQIRAPEWVRAIAMEWFWRMASNPRRLVRRYLLCALILPVLAVRIVTQSVSRSREEAR